MGDFLLDFRDRHLRSKNAELLRFYPDMVVDCIANDYFALYVSRPEGSVLWEPFVAPDGISVALAGRVALDKAEWDSAAQLVGAGGLACKAIYLAYKKGGIEGLYGFNGGFSIHLYDSQCGVYFLVTDRGGLFPCYTLQSSCDLVSSHPDILERASAKSIKVASQSDVGFDLASMAQFVSTGVVSFPHSYYRNIAALPTGSAYVYTFGEAGVRRSVKGYATCDAKRLIEMPEREVAIQLAEAISTASRRRTQPILGRTAVALSGGLDSRAILCSAEKHPDLFAFCAFDEQNEEFRCAKEIADAVGIQLFPFARTFDHYGSSAEMGVRISGGMGELTSNHFLGFRDQLRKLGVDNLITGCYFDYLFKSLALDAKEKIFLRSEEFSNFSFQSYLPHFSIGKKFEQEVRERMNALFPPAERTILSPTVRAQISSRRVFPLYHEGDNAQRLIPQRVMGWYTPAADSTLLDLSLSMPPAMKLNAKVFRMAVQIVCGDKVSNIPDNNTGLPLSASRFRVAFNRYRIALRRRAERRNASLATSESWPNWPYYMKASPALRELWQRPGYASRELIAEITGKSFSQNLEAYRDHPTQYFMRLLTLKIWLDQRGGHSD